MIAYLGELAVFILITYLMYSTFFAEPVKEWVEKRNKKKQAITAADKIAKVKLVSNDDKDIEKFIANNAETLSDAMVSKLVERIETIRNEQVISADNVLKTRFELLEKSSATRQAEDLPIEEPVKRAARR
jgi:hypothetical protein